MLLLGNTLLNEAVDALAAAGRGRRLPPLDIVLFRHDDVSLYRAAIWSARKKQSAFARAGVPVRLITDDNWQTYGPDLPALLQSGRLRIVQHPLPAALQPWVSDDALDLDCSIRAGRPEPAVCEAAAALALRLNPARTPMVVVGGEGRFGRRIRAVLQDAGLVCASLEKDEPMSGIADYRVVVAAASVGRCIRREHVDAGQVIIDIGFIAESVPSGHEPSEHEPAEHEPLGPGARFYGNVCPDAYAELAAVTPVPGGIGPMQVGLLIARYAGAVGLDLGYEVLDRLPCLGVLPRNHARL